MKTFLSLVLLLLPTVNAASQKPAGTTQPVITARSVKSLPIDGLQFETGGQSGTSNRASAAKVQLRFDGPGMLVILPRARLDAAISALVPQWRGRHRAQRGVPGG